MVAFKQVSLKAKAILFGCAIGVFPMLALGGIAYSTTNKHIVEQSMVSQQYHASSLSDKVNRFLLERYGDIQIIASLPMLNNSKSTGSLSFQDKQKSLDNFIKAYGVYDSVGAFDLQGNVIAQSSGKALSNHADRTYFQQVLKTGKPVISADLSQSSKAYVIHFAAPIKEVGTNKIIGVVRARMPIKAINDLVADFSKNGDEWYLVNNETQEFFAAVETEKLGEEAKSEFPILTQMQSQERANTVITKHHNAEKLLTYAPFERLQGLPAQNWSVVLANQTNEVFSTQRVLGIAILIGTGITGAIVSTIALLATNATSRFLKGIANGIASSSTEIATTVEQQERTVSQQAASVQQTTITMEELGASSRQAAEQAEVSASGAREALAIAENGSQAVRETMDGMNKLRDNVRAIAEQIIRLSEQSGQIANISDLVADIANQTNMLALNAAVEAARAGEQGKGFGVVATEIRKLADESKKSAEKINTLVQDLQASMNSTVMVTDEGSKKTEASIELARGTAQAFNGVTEAINNVFVNSQQISLSAKQQAVAVQQVIAAMNAINLGAQETSAGINQVRVSTEELEQAAKNLQKVV